MTLTVSGFAHRINTDQTCPRCARFLRGCPLQGSVKASLGGRGSARHEQHVVNRDAAFAVILGGAFGSFLSTQHDISDHFDAVRARRRRRYRDVYLVGAGIRRNCPHLSRADASSLQDLGGSTEQSKRSLATPQQAAARLI